MKQVAIVIPVYNEAENLALFLKETASVCDAIPGYDFTWLFVNDGSTDGTLTELRRLSSENGRIKYLSFSRNFGKESAIYAGLQHAEGDYVILMDGDLQHPPALIPSMIEAVTDGGFEAAGAKRKASLSSRMFTSLNNRVSSVKLEKGATDFMCMSRKFVDSVLKLSESQRFSKGLFAWVGFEIKWLDYEQGPRAGGKSKWSSSKLVHYAADGITSFSILPLRIVTIVGAVISLLAFIYIIATLIKTWITGIDVPGYVTTLCAILFLGGLVLLAIGILGAYIGRIYLESKDRPLYILDESSEQKDGQDEKQSN
ncbi:MAG: glycosyltransferase family 2 protein [Lachnospiraceae bacterium]|nr:glycosyltransferase family 2 protein [Lachnospiraceae bacterium]